VVSYRAALEELTRLRMPHEWSFAQYSLAGTLATIGERERGTEHLECAVELWNELLQAPEASWLSEDARQASLDQALTEIARRRAI
jgi:hypothetical protein